MTPLEAMTLAIAAHFGENDHPEDAARAALLALEKADVNIPAACISGPTAMRVSQRDRIAVFRAMCRAIAESGR